MQKSRVKVATDMKSAPQLWAEEEARVVIARNEAALEARAQARAKAEEEIWDSAAMERARQASPRARTSSYFSTGSEAFQRDPFRTSS